ncbi:alpha/beta fold hydrolase [Nocardioides sp.]|uniref:alpha/beta fold hydrolase n=1 Tax=Nocardioides sp. TaxID=35761 RepID=UPI003784120F
MSGPADVQYLTINGHRRAFVKVGSGPALLLLHGLGCDHTTWESVIEPLSRRYTVIAPDLLGHGRSDKPRADYTLGGFANGMRDLLTVLGIDKVSVVGHSFGGGVAMQFAYQYPERTERLMLVASGGLGPEVTPAIRMISLPGFHPVMTVLTLPGIRHAGKLGLRALSGTGLPATRDLDEVAEIFDTFRDAHARHAVRHVVKAVVDWRGQVLSMAGRAYLIEAMPLWVVWGQDDQVIPVAHAARAAELAPHARVEVFDDAGHFPHKDHPQRFARLVHDFVRTTEASSYSRARFRALLRSGGGAASLQAVSDTA